MFCGLEMRMLTLARRDSHGEGVQVWSAAQRYQPWQYHDHSKRQRHFERLGSHWDGDTTWGLRVSEVPHGTSLLYSIVVLFLTTPQGTWQFMLCALLMSLSKTHNIQDGLESFFWVTLFKGLHTFQHKGQFDMGTFEYRQPIAGADRGGTLK